MCICHGSGAISSQFLLLILHGCRASIATLGAGSNGTAECASKCRTLVGRSSDQDHTAGPSAPAGWRTWRSSRTSGGYSCSWEARHMGRRRESVARHDECRKQHGCVEQRNSGRSEEGRYREHLTARTFFSVLSVCTCQSVVTTFSHAHTCVWLKVHVQDETCAHSQKHFVRTPCHSWVFQALLPSVRHLHRPRHLQRR